MIVYLSLLELSFDLKFCIGALEKKVDFFWIKISGEIRNINVKDVLYVLKLLYGDSDEALCDNIRLVTTLSQAFRC